MDVRVTVEETFKDGRRTFTKGDMVTVSQEDANRFFEQGFVSIDGVKREHSRAGVNHVLEIQSGRLKVSNTTP